MSKLKVYIGRHRGKPALIWKEEQPNGNRPKVRYRLIQNIAKAQVECHQLEEQLNTPVEDILVKHLRRPLAEHLAEYHDYLVASGVVPVVARLVRQRAGRVLSLSGIGFFADLTASRVQTTIAGLRAVPRTKRKRPEDQPLLGPRSRNFHRAAIRQFIRWLIEDGRASHYPLKGMRMERVEIDLRHPRIPITPDQFQKLYLGTIQSDAVIECLSGLDRGRLYALAFVSGLRRAEIASLIPGSFDLDSDPPTVTVEAANSKGRRRDVVPLPPSAVTDLLRPWLATLRPDEPLYPGLKTKDTAKMVRRDLERVGIPYEENGQFRDFHSIRHGYVSALWAGGASAAVIRELARHRNLATTQLYTHVDLSEKARAVQGLPAVPKLPSSEKPQDGERAA